MGTRIEFRRSVTPNGVADLDAIRRDQLEIVGRMFDGVERSAESRLRDEPIPPGSKWDWDDGNLAAHGLVLHDAWIGTRHVYDVWLHHGRDNGCVFTAGTTEVIAGRMQDEWVTAGTHERSPLDEALHDAESDDDDDDDDD